jgi:hypothetical protein
LIKFYKNIKFSVIKDVFSQFGGLMHSGLEERLKLKEMPLDEGLGKLRTSFSGEVEF